MVTQPTFVIIEHPNGFAERTSVEEIRRLYDMSLDEYRFFVAAEPDNAVARNARRERRKAAVLASTAERIEIPDVDAVLANFQYVKTASTIEDFSDNSSEQTGGGGFREKQLYIPIPFESFLSDEERRKIFIPKGPFRPGFASRGAPAAAYNYVPVPASVKNALKTGDGIDFGPSYAEQFISNVPERASAGKQKVYWEKGLLNAYFSLYEVSWEVWPLLIPWLDSIQLSNKATSYGCALRWDWQSRLDFLEESKLSWTLDELKLLIDWYPEYQDNHNVQNIFAGRKPFIEVQTIAKALRLPSKADIKALEKRARLLSGTRS